MEDHQRQKQRTRPHRDRRDLDQRRGAWKRHGKRRCEEVLVDRLHLQADGPRGSVDLLDGFGETILPRGRYSLAENPKRAEMK